MGQPVFYLLAGPNGAGKSTLYRALVLAGTIPATAEFVNADLHEAEHLQHIADVAQRSAKARQWADARRAKLLQAGQSFASETVFSHESKLALIQEAQAKGFFVMLLVVALDQPERLLARVAQRVTEGGHPVPPERILARYPRTLAHLTQAVRLADAAILYDSADVTPGTHTAVALCKGDWTQELVQPMPEWARQVLWD
ncbi:MAG: zeta toxin family protein [Gammaproteobacteria bacterium]|nr:zeta toxin family protein [Gammaproteobacteria bacterium]MBU0814134.1 zeta toxin family protein [Gammaproteobacteria bacterium]MBU1786346.1 zeta toxin family protein [Gammaproteobacteria bacterium]